LTRVWRFTVFNFDGAGEVLYGRYATDTTIALLGGTPIKNSGMWVGEDDIDEVGILRHGVQPRPTNF
jgi:hypothetical protein